MTTSSTSLVLGSGGARGMAHIGVIRCLEERGYAIRSVAGSSIGAVVGGIHAAGKLDVYTDWVTGLQRSDVVRLLDWSFDQGALFKGERIIDVLRELVGDTDIEDLPIPFTAVATDLTITDARREIWLNEGSLFDAIRTSIAVPGVFAPVIVDGRVMVDGGIVNPVPVGPTLNDRTEATIAVDLNGRWDSALGSDPSMNRRSGPLQYAYQQSIGRYLGKWLPSAPQGTAERIGFSDLLTRSMEAMQATITQFKLAATTPSVVISIPRNICSFFDFHRAEELIDYGYERASATMNQYEENTFGSDEPPGSRQ